jgi:hypothetical protein
MCSICSDWSCQLCLAASSEARKNTVQTPGGGISIDGPAAVARYRVLAIWSALGLESKGMKVSSHRPSALSLVRKEFGIKARTAAKAYAEFDTLLRGRGIIV